MKRVTRQSENYTMHAIQKYVRNSMESAYNNKYHDSIIRNTGNYDINNMSVEVKIKTLSIHVQFTPAD